MSARQNKKYYRKGRGNADHRERTVTTLTEDPTTHLLIPTPTEEPAKYPLPSPIPVQIPVSMPAQFFQQPSDLEVLQNLKDMIKNGQHEFYRAVPQPQALAAIYLGPNAQAYARTPLGDTTSSPRQASTGARQTSA
ncbi:hypothetical protein C8J57DRAFT_688728, partial [Mycena rebaudengoi]